MALIVQKYGGTSVGSPERIKNVARRVAKARAQGHDVVVVVSAQGDTTDDLIAKAAEITHNPSAREMDMLLASGEQISISLLAMALILAGIGWSLKRFAQAHMPQAGAISAPAVPAAATTTRVRRGWRGHA